MWKLDDFHSILFVYRRQTNRNKEIGSNSWLSGISIEAIRYKTLWVFGHFIQKDSVLNSKTWRRKTYSHQDFRSSPRYEAGCLFSYGTWLSSVSTEYYGTGYFGKDTLISSVFSANVVWILFCRTYRSIPWKHDTFIKSAWGMLG